VNRVDYLPAKGSFIILRKTMLDARRRFRYSVEAEIQPGATTQTSWKWVSRVAARLAAAGGQRSVRHRAL
jgi:hypothetical protein